MRVDLGDRQEVGGGLENAGRGGEGRDWRDEEDVEKLVKGFEARGRGRVRVGGEVDGGELEQASEKSCGGVVSFFSSALETNEPFSGRFRSRTLRSPPLLDSHSSTHTAVSSSRAFFRSFAIGYLVTPSALVSSPISPHSSHRSSISPTFFSFPARTCFISAPTTSAPSGRDGPLRTPDIPH